ncbi:hypothetical protein FOPG_19269 [Fusarium oxysporum f. sp. conglutinans race 2 54008]|uniref:Uncharacterized protein n=1 Tax=Fusarium oxysporum f. sp. conglutinans race 2 54008 TaxID=1089457 RepID=X0GMF4_FUSOX|nr:hypothetical protein FOPG_19269 [Fusarium oxysporum f. sp. conglutinans race 2 54008]
MELKQIAEERRKLDERETNVQKDQEEDKREYRKSVERNTVDRVILKQPAYKNGTIRRISEPCHISDLLKFTMQKFIHQGLSNLCQYRSSQNGDGGTLYLSTFDKDLASYWNEFEAEARNLVHQKDPGSNWLSDLRSNLKRDVDTCYSYWVERMSGPNGKANLFGQSCFYARKIGFYIATDCQQVCCWRSSGQDPHQPIESLDTARDLAASQSKSEFQHNSPSKLLWSIAGRQLQFIKCSKARAPILVPPRTYKLLRPDGKRIHQS